MRIRDCKNNSISRISTVAVVGCNNNYCWCYSFDLNESESWSSCHVALRRHSALVWRLAAPPPGIWLASIMQTSLLSRQVLLKWWSLRNHFLFDLLRLEVETWVNPTRLGNWASMNAGHISNDLLRSLTRQLFYLLLSCHHNCHGSFLKASTMRIYLRRSSVWP